MKRDERKKKRQLQKGEFLIIRFHQQLVMSQEGDSYPAWGCAFCMENWTGIMRDVFPYILRVREIDKERAQKIIRKYGLVRTYNEKGDEVYDTPEGIFREKYARRAIIDDKYLWIQEKAAPGEPGTAVKIP